MLNNTKVERRRTLTIIKYSTLGGVLLFVVTLLLVPLSSLTFPILNGLVYNQWFPERWVPAARDFYEVVGISKAASERNIFNNLCSLSLQELRIASEIMLGLSFIMKPLSVIKENSVSSSIFIAEFRCISTFLATV